MTCSITWRTTPLPFFGQGTLLAEMAELLEELPCTGYEPCNDSARLVDMWCRRCRALWCFNHDEYCEHGDYLCPRPGCDDIDLGDGQAGC